MIVTKKTLFYLIGEALFSCISLFLLFYLLTQENVSYVSLINAAGEIVTLGMHEELSEGVKLVSLKPSQAIFQKEDESFLIINFKNQIKEVKEIN